MADTDPAPSPLEPTDQPLVAPGEPSDQQFASADDTTLEKNTALEEDTASNADAPSEGEAGTGEVDSVAGLTNPDGHSATAGHETGAVAADRLAPGPVWTNELVDSLPTPACVLDDSNGLVHANARFAEVTGWAPGGTATWDDFLVPDRRDGLEIQRALGMLEQDEAPPPRCLRSVDGTPRHGAIDHIELGDGHRLVVVNLGEPPVGRTPDHLADLIWAETSDAAFRLGPDGHIVHRNAAAATLVGHEVVDLFGSDDPSDDGEPRLIDEITSAIASVGRWDGELQLSADASLVPASAAASGDDEILLIVRRSAAESAGASSDAAGMADRDALIGSIDELFAGTHPDTNAVIAVQIDGLSDLHLHMGLRSGNVLLTQIAERFRHAVRPDDRWARIGPDAFGLLCTDVAGGDSATAVAGRIIGLLSAPVAVGSTTITLQTNVGVAVLNGPAEAEAALRDAEIATEEAARTDRSRLQLFDPSMRERAKRRMDMLSGLGNALETDAIKIAYQPIYDLERRTPIAAEALMRWHPSPSEAFPAADFIDIARANGLIQQLGDHLRHRAVHDIGAIQRSSGRLGSFLLSLNVSTEEVVEHDLTRVIQDLCATADVKPNSLIVEMSETTLITQHTEATRTIEELRALGLRVALDDFGSGYSSLSHLARSPVDLLKIDPSITATIVDDDESSAIVDAIVHLARRLKIGVSAEGIETEEQLAELRRAGVRSGQGHLLARPGDLSTLRHHLSL